MQTIVGLFVRHTLTSIGGALVAAGYLTSADWQTVSGAVAALVGVGLSVIQKRRAK